MQGPKEERERLIFSLFSRELDLTDAGSRVESRPPPEPDILLTKSDETCIAFELVEILDQDYSGSTQRQLDTKSACYVHLDAMPEREQSRFREKYANADIHIEFDEKLTLRRRKQSLDQVFNALIGLPNDVEGEIAIDDERLQKFVQYMHVNRGNFSGPLFDIQSAIWVGDPTTDLIRAKLEKLYETPHPIRLLAYIETNPMYPDDVWQTDLDDLLKELDSTCQFESIYVFDCTSKEVKRLWCRSL
jgi:hypothetical protein